jgi:hypothetical protein
MEYDAEKEIHLYTYTCFVFIWNAFTRHINND